MAPQSLYSQLWEKSGKQMSLEFSLKCSQTLHVNEAFFQLTLIKPS